MSSAEWTIKGREFVNCNCAYGCPCQFNAMPTHGDCRAIATFAIDEGHHGDVKLDGLKAIGILSWPGAIHEGNGSCQLIIDERADERQREALIRIMSGQDTEPMATVWSVFATTLTTVHDPVFAPIEFEVDVDARTANVSVPGMVEGRGEPIRNPITGDEHRVRIDLPHGFEYTLAEVGSGTSKSNGPLAMELESSYGQFARIHLSHAGVVR